MAGCAVGNAIVFARFLHDVSRMFDLKVGTGSKTFGLQQRSNFSGKQFPYHKIARSSALACVKLRRNPGTTHHRHPNRPGFWRQKRPNCLSFHSYPTVLNRHSSSVRSASFAAPNARQERLDLQTGPIKAQGNPYLLRPGAVLIQS